MKPLFTVFTPTHNRAHLIGRLYESLKRQTCQDFIWQIIDDGSTDNTSEIVQGFISDGILRIDYHYIENGYLHLASKLSSQITTTKYIIRQDDDDVFPDHALSRFLEEWVKIENEGKKDIGEIRALSIREDGTISGVYQPQVGQPSIDTTYLEVHLNRKTQLENISCWKTEVWRQLFKGDEDKWLYNEVTYISDSIFWLRMSRICRSRYIFEPLRIYYDTPVSLMHSFFHKNKKHLINSVFSSYVELNENQDCYYKYPKYFLIGLVVYEVYGIRLHFPFWKLLLTLDSLLARFLFLILYIPAWVYSKSIITE